MSLSDRRSFLSVLLALPVAACGFEPVYQQDTAALGLRGKVLLDTPTTEMIFDLNRALEDRLGATRDPIMVFEPHIRNPAQHLRCRGQPQSRVTILSAHPRTTCATCKLA